MGTPSRWNTLRALRVLECVGPGRNRLRSGPHTGPGRGRSRMALPAAMVLSGIVSVQAGAGIAARLFHEIPPAAVTGLRLWTSAVVMAAIAGRGLARAFGDLAKRRAWSDGLIAVSFGIALLIMNFSIYQAFSRIPLGVAVTIEFLGPLAVAVAGSRHVRDVGWVVLAAAGVVLLTQGGHGHLDLTGVLFAGVAGACWAAYIVLSSATGRRFPGSAGLAIAMVVAGDPGHAARRRRREAARCSGPPCWPPGRRSASSRR